MLQLTEKKTPKPKAKPTKQPNKKTNKKAPTNQNQNQQQQKASAKKQTKQKPTKIYCKVSRAFWPMFLSYSDAVIVRETRTTGFNFFPCSQWYFFDIHD